MTLSDIDGDFLVGALVCVLGAGIVVSMGTCARTEFMSDNEAKVHCYRHTCERGAIRWEHNMCACVVIEAPAKP